MRAAAIYVRDTLAGHLWEDAEGYVFRYAPAYAAAAVADPVSLGLPRRVAPYRSRRLFGFFDGLIPEGWLLEVAEKNWKQNPRDRMGLLLVCCRDCIGTVRVVPAEVPEPAS